MRIKKRKECSTCGALILWKSKKCAQCGSFQDIRRFLDVGNTSLSLIIAFFTLLLLVSEQSYELYERFQSKKLLVRVDRELHTINEDELIVLYSNVGHSEAILPSGIICVVPLAKEESNFINQSLNKSSDIVDIKKDEIDSFFVLSYSSVDKGNQLILGANQVRLITYEFIELVPVTFENSNSDDFNSYCNISVDNINIEPEWIIEPNPEIFSKIIIELKALDLFFLQKGLRKLSQEIDHDLEE